MDNKQTFVVFLGSVGQAQVLKTEGNKFCLDNGQWYEIPTVYAFRGTREECVQRLTNDLNKFFDEMDKEDASISV